MPQIFVGEGIVRAAYLLIAGIILSGSQLQAAEGTTATGVAAFGARGDASTDDTTAIQQALNAKAAAGGGEVRLDAKPYRIAGSLTVASGVTLAGEWQAPHHADKVFGSALFATGGRGVDNSAAPALIELSPSSTVRGITIFHPDRTSLPCSHTRSPFAGEA